MKKFTDYEVLKMKKRVSNAFNCKNFTKKRLEQFLLIEKNDIENKKYAELHKQIYGKKINNYNISINYRVYINNSYR